MTTEIIPLFSTPVVISDLPDAPALNPELLKIIAERHHGHVDACADALGDVCAAQERHEQVDGYSAASRAFANARDRVA